MSYPDRLIDKRVVHRYIRKGMVDQAKYDAFIAALPNVEDNATTALQEDAPDEAETSGGEANPAEGDERPFGAE